MRILPDSRTSDSASSTSALPRRSAANRCIKTGSITSESESESQRCVRSTDATNERASAEAHEPTDMWTKGVWTN